MFFFSLAEEECTWAICAGVSFYTSVLRCFCVTVLDLCSFLCMAYVWICLFLFHFGISLLCPDFGYFCYYLIDFVLFICLMFPAWIVLCSLQLSMTLIFLLYFLEVVCNCYTPHNS